MAKFVRTNRGGKALHFEGYIMYQKIRESKEAFFKHHCLTFQMHRIEADCYFIWRKVQSLGFAEVYRSSDPTLKQFIQKMAAIAFVLHRLFDQLG